MNARKGLLCEVDLKDWGRVQLRGYAYASNGSQAISVFSGNHGPIAVLTVNLPEHLLMEDEVFVKTWSENEEIAKEILEKCDHLFEDTGKNVPTGHVRAAIWRMK